MKTKLYDVVKKLLTNYPALRDSDKLLMWNVWGIEGFISSYGNSLVRHITRDNFMKATSAESITRCRRKIQEEFPELQSSKNIKEARDQKASEKGTFVYREKINKNL